MIFWSLETLVFMLAGGLLGTVAALVVSVRHVNGKVELMWKNTLQKHEDRLYDLEKEVYPPVDLAPFYLRKTAGDEPAVSLVERVNTLQDSVKYLNKLFVRHYHEDGSLRQKGADDV